MISGGFIRGSANLVEGAPGTGKTTLALQFIYTGITKYEEPGLIITFEEFPQQYYHDALQFGWDLKDLQYECDSSCNQDSRCQPGLSVGF